MEALLQSEEITEDKFPVSFYEDDSRFACRVPTWASSIKENFEHFLPDFDKNWQHASRTYGCRKPQTGSKFMRNPKLARLRANPSRQHPIKKDGTFAEWFTPLNVSYYIGLDLSSSHDSTGIAMSHWDSIRQLVVADLILRVPVPEDGELRFRDTRQFIYALIERGFEPALVTTDSWQCGCGWVEVPLLNGEIKTMEELASLKEPFWVYGCEDDMIVPALATARLSSEDAEVYEIEIDNGKKVGFTDNHRMMMRDGSYKMVRELVVGDSLMPLYRHYRGSGKRQVYERLFHPSGFMEYTHQMVGRMLGHRRGKGWVTHHKDFNSRNNEPSNLEEMEWGAHSTYHNELLWPEWRRKRQAEVMKKRNKEYKKEFDAARAKAGATRKERGIASRVLEEIWKDPDYKEKMRLVRRQQMIDRYATRQVNHKVVSIRQIESQAVYDLHVPGVENFALDSGVFVHNSYETKQELNDRGIETKLFSVDRNTLAYDSALTLMVDGRLDYYLYEPLCEEWEDLIVVDGKIDHPNKGSKDVTDAFVASVFHALELGKAQDGRVARWLSDGEDEDDLGDRKVRRV